MKLQAKMEREGMERQIKAREVCVLLSARALTGGSAVGLYRPSLALLTYRSWAFVLVFPAGVCSGI